MEMKNLSWQAFKTTGDIDAYLLYCAARDSEKHEENQWKALKQEASSQSAATSENQIV